MAGVYFAFSVFIMKAFADLDEEQGVAAMNAINSVILSSLFMPLFWGTTLASVALVGLAAFRLGEPGSTIALAGGIVYVAGMFLVTIFFNVPLNNTLAAAGAGENTVWAGYLSDWTRWNHVRTLASAAATALFILSIARQ